MSNTLVKTVRLRLGAGSAKPGPAIGQALGPLGLNMADFCKQFNEKTKNYEKDTPIPVVLSAFSNRTFTFITKTPPTGWLLMKCAGITAGSARPGHDVVGKVHVKHIYEIGLIKHTEAHLKRLSVEAICKTIVATAASMGIQVSAEKLDEKAYNHGSQGDFLAFMSESAGVPLNQDLFVPFSLAPPGTGTAIFTAARDGDVDALRELLVHWKGDIVVNEKDEIGTTPLHTAASHGHKECVIALLEAGADVNIKNSYGQTAYSKAKTKEIESLIIPKELQAGVGINMDTKE